MPILIMLHYRLARLKYSHAQRHTELCRTITGIPPIIALWGIPMIVYVCVQKKTRDPQRGRPPQILTFIISLPIEIASYTMPLVFTMGIMGRFSLSHPKGI